MRNCWNLRLSDCVIFLFFIVTSATAQFRQTSTGDSLRASSYVFPIEPGKTAMLTGTMGELRNTHFHGGLDINTPSIGYKVFSSNDGYIAKAVVSTSGYGNSLFVKHPDGNTTLYAHLSEFSGVLGEFVKTERYRRRQSEVEIEFSPRQFPVKKGEVIALSGNTGSSGGPHLHFELRDSANIALNPLVAGFSEVVDHLPPIIQKVALRTLTPSSRINDQFGRFEFYVVKEGNHYLLPAPILAKGRIGIEVLAYDKQENSPFKFGISLMEVKANKSTVFTQHINKIKFSENRNILALMDYRILELRGQRYNKLYVDDGNKLPYYAGSQLHGIELGEVPIDVEVALSDFFRNTTLLNLTLKPSPVTKESLFMQTPEERMQAELYEHILKVTVSHCTPADSTASFYENSEKFNLTSSYRNKGTHVFLLDVSKAIPDSVITCNGTWKSNWVARIPSESEYTYFSDRLEISFPKNAVYDTLLLQLQIDSLNNQELVRIGTETLPLRTPIQISYKPSPAWTPSRTSGIYRKDGGYAYLGNNWKNGRYTFSSQSFGNFVILNDTLAPTIKPISLNHAVARLKIGDNLSGIAYFEASINGQWLLLNYDYKTGTLFSERLNKEIPLSGVFELKVVDNAGNEAIFKQKI